MKKPSKVVNCHRNICSPSTAQENTVVPFLNPSSTWAKNFKSLTWKDYFPITITLKRQKQNFASNIYNNVSYYITHLIFIEHTMLIVLT